MPAKNSIKQYLENGFYHIYNRGVEKRDIFLDEQDYAVFLSYLKDYLLEKDVLALEAIFFSPNSSFREKDKAKRLLAMNNFFGEIDLLCYCLMPNHFHFLIKQNHLDGIDRFLNSLGTRYTQYFNKKYKRVGCLCQDVYKAVLIESDEQLLHLSRYIHLNPGKTSQQPSSLPEYLDLRHTAWVKPQFILDYFNKDSKNNSYGHFMGEVPDWEYVAPLGIDHTN